MDEPFEAPTAILDGRLWISGYPIDRRWLQQQGIELVVDVGDPDLRLDTGTLGSIAYRKQPRPGPVTSPRSDPQT